MTWFKVDDGWHKHRKRIRAGVDMEGMAAQGLWAAAGSWSSDELTDGWIPVEVVDYLSPKLGRKLAARLVHSSLWTAENRNGEEGWQFHGWEDQNPTREEELAKAAKKSSGGALGNHRRWHVGQKSDPRCVYCLPTNGQASDLRSVVRSDNRSVERSEVRSVERNGTESLANPPTRPDPSRPEPLSSKPKTVGGDLDLPLPREDQSEVGEDQLPAAKRTPKVWCDEHAWPDDRDCGQCQVQHGDRAYWSKQRASHRSGK